MYTVAVFDFLNHFNFQFFHDVDETGQWLQEDLKRLHDTFEITPLQGDKKDADRLCKELDVSIPVRYP